MTAPLGFKYNPDRSPAPRNWLARWWYRRRVRQIKRARS